MSKKYDRVMVLSYMPLLYGEAGEDLIEKVQDPEFKEMFEDRVSPSAAFCLWGQDDDGVVSIVLGYERAEEVAEHLIKWAEGLPNLWFNFHLEERPERYAICLFPNVQKGFERYRLAHYMTHGEVLPKDTECEFLCEPLFFISEDTGMLQKVKELLGDEIKVNLINMDLVNPKDPLNFPEEKMVTLGKFLISENNEHVNSYFDTLFKGDQND